MKKHLALSLALASISLVACHKKQTPGPAQVISSIMPAHAAGGETVTINGNNFSTNKAEDLVTINGVNATVVSATATALTVTVPAQAGSGKVQLAVKGGQISTGRDFTYDWKISTATTLPLTKDGAGFTFTYAFGMASDAHGNLFVADPVENKIFKVSANNTVSVFAGKGTAGKADGAPASAQFNSPAGIVFDAAGNLYVADTGNNQIRKIDPSGNVTTIAGSGTAGTGDGAGTAATFNGPTGIAINSTGELFVTDGNSGLLRKITSPSYQVTTIAGTGATAGMFIYPDGICPDAKGFMYIVGFGNHQIFKLMPGGALTAFAGSGTGGKVDGIGTAAKFAWPTNICNADGNLYVADNGNHTIRQITLDGVVTTFAGAGATSTAGAAITFSYPYGITFGTKGHSLYVSDHSGSTIQKLLLQ